MKKKAKVVKIRVFKNDDGHIVCGCRCTRKKRLHKYSIGCYIWRRAHT